MTLDLLRRTLFEQLTTEPLKIDSGCEFTPQKEKIFKDFVRFCKEQLELDEQPLVVVQDNRENGLTTGAFDPETNKIYVYGKGRALVDIMRTYAHELTHYLQNIENRIQSTERDWDLESEADTVAGRLVYTFTHDSPENMETYNV